MGVGGELLSVCGLSVGAISVGGEGLTFVGGGIGGDDDCCVGGDVAEGVRGSLSKEAEEGAMEESGSSMSSLLSSLPS